MPDKKRGDFYTGVRERGMLNSLMSQPVIRYEELHPGRVCKWEHLGKDNDDSFVTYREAQGYQIVKQSELYPEGEWDSRKTDSPVRRGDSILMSAPAEVQQAILDQDAEAAELDYRTPEITYKEHMAEKHYRLSTGETRQGKGFGEIRRVFEEGTPDEFIESRNPNVKKGGET